MWGLSNVACHDAQSAKLIIDHPVLVDIVTSLQHNIRGVQVESFFAMSKLLVTADTDDFDRLLTKYPGLLDHYITLGLETGSNCRSSESTTKDILGTIKALMFRRNIVQDHLAKFDFASVLDEAAAELYEND